MQNIRVKKRKKNIKLYFFSSFTLLVVNFEEADVRTLRLNDIRYMRTPNTERRRHCRAAERDVVLECNRALALKRFTASRGNHNKMIRPFLMFILSLIELLVLV